MQDAKVEWRRVLLPEVSDSRKRPLDGDVDNGTTKRSHYGSNGEGPFNMKILIPSSAAGAIIGKGGETIAQLQKDTGARIKMSKANDFYPGTAERICLVTGNTESIMKVLKFIMEKIRDRPEPYERSSAEDIQLKILVPNSTAGMIIGKSGAYVTQIKDASGAYVQLSQKAKDQILQERCITVIGEVSSCEKACNMILEKITEDPLSGSYLNVSYAHVNGPVANNSPTGSPFANLSGHRTPSGSFGSTASLNSASGFLMNGSGNSLNLSLNLGNPAGGLASATLTAQLLEHIKLILRGSGYSDQVTAEITAAMRTLAQYGILGMGLGLTGNGSNHHMSNRGYHSNGMGNNMFGPGSSTSLDSFNIGGGQSNMKDEETKTEMEIADNIVGAILGPGGRSLVEIQHLSGASIQISKKGIYAPGTTNRIVSIVGTGNAIATAQYLINKRISEEEAKRARHGGAVGSGSVMLRLSSSDVQGV
ncbi:hypothetical protein L9F63_021765, partial [Diploptera punctata]